MRRETWRSEANLVLVIDGTDTAKNRLERAESVSGFLGNVKEDFGSGAGGRYQIYLTCYTKLRVWGLW